LHIDSLTSFLANY